MDELKKAVEIALSGDARERALTGFRQQVAAWEVAMPDTELLALDFGLGEFDSTGLVECWIANEIEAGYCGKYLFVADGQRCPMHHHHEKHETFFVAEGCIRMVHDGREIEMTEGDVLAVPPLSKHSFTGKGPALLLELSRPCIIDDNYLEDKNIPIGGNAG